LNIIEIPDLVRTYRREGQKALATGCLSAGELAVYFAPWFLSVYFNGGLTAARAPTSFPAAKFLEGLITRESRVFEYGAGASTLFFAKQVHELITVEHDRNCLERTAAKMGRRHGVRWRRHLVEPVPGAEPSRYPPTDPEAYASTDARFAGMSFREYASAIERYEDNYFDVVLIDGRARPACFKHAVAKVKVGGYIVLDNAEREQYRWVDEAAQKLGFQVREFWGPGPNNRYFWRTIFLRKVRDRFSLNELDAKLERHLDFDGGTFVEAGANDGVAQSNTLYFESRRGWRGLLIEPVPQLAHDCRRYRPHALVEQVALVASDHGTGPVALRYANLMSTVKGAMRTAEEEDAHIAAGMAVQKIQSYDLVVPAATLSSLLEKHALHHIDLLSLDVEGYELPALKGLDLQRHRPRYILVEARYPDEVHAYLSSHYELAEHLSFHDRLYRLRSKQAR